MAQRLASGHVMQEISPEEKEEQIRDFIGYKKIYDQGEYIMRCYPDGWFLPSMHKRIQEKVYNFKFNPEDVLIMTYPKCGTTWTQEIVWTMMLNKNFDHPMSSMPVMAKSPFIEMDGLALKEDIEGAEGMMDAFHKLCPGKDKDEGIMWQIAECIPSPRIIKTHLALSLFQKDLINSCKIVYVVRNPRDVVMSFLHHSRLFMGHGYVGTFNQFFDYFLEDKLFFSPFWPHVKEAWALRDHPNMHFIFYEDLKMNTKEEYTKLSQFLNADLTPEQIDEIIEYTSFPVMKKREEQGMQFSKDLVNEEVVKKDGGFFRKGQAGGWKDKLSPSQEAKIDLWIKKNTIGTGLKFDLYRKKDNAN